LLLVAWTGCGSSAADPTVLPASAWGREAAAVACAHIFGCCDATELPVLRWPYTDEAQCRQMMAVDLQSAVTDNIGQGIGTYDGKAARRCVDEMAATPCTQIPVGDVGYLFTPSCNKVFRGTLPLGAPCEDLDFICQSGNCTGTCAPPRPCWDVTCDVGQYCDVTLSACTPVKADGAACGSNIECAATSVCLTTTGVCGTPLPEGAACGTSTDCTTAACLSGTSGTCGPRFCDGV